MTRLPVLIATPRYEDARGWFSETYSEARLAAHGVTHPFVQDNQSYSRLAGTLRGIHFQKPPHGQAKLVRCLRGSVMDYAVDLRRGSPTYGRHVATRLSAAGGDQFYIPVGFGHAFITLEADTEVAYKVSDVYAPDAAGGIIWDDPQLDISWPAPARGPVLSDQDRRLPRLAAFDSPFPFDGEPLHAPGERG